MGAGALPAAHPSSRESYPGKGRRTGFLSRLHILSCLTTGGERTMHSACKPHFVDCHSPSKSDSERGIQPRNVLDCAHEKRSVRTAGAALSGAQHICPPCCYSTSAAWQEQAELQAWGGRSRAMRRSLPSTGETSPGLLEGLLWAGKSLIIIPASFRKK